MAKYDVVVVGAGIQGAGVAQAAAAAGYSVLVLEQTAVAAGTSSKSSKLIHGGLRYLESAQFNLVRESLHERALLLRLAPELVTLAPLHIPIYKNSRRSPLTIRTGLCLYALLASFDKNARFQSLPPVAWDTLIGLEQRQLRAVYRYFEAQTDDAALTRAVLQSALTLGAELELPARFVSAQRNQQECEVHYTSGAGEQIAHCSVLINCAGPWATSVALGCSPAINITAVDLVKGSHLLLPPILNQHFYLEAPQDKRAVFVLPWQGKLMVGTTEKIHREAPELARCSDEERDYLLATLQHYFPQLRVDPHTVESFAGLRVLPRSDANAFSRPRDVLFDIDDEINPRVLSIMGGKLTTYRATAEMVMMRLQKSLPQKQKRGDTRQLLLTPVA